MNLDLMDALSDAAMDFYVDALDRYPSLLLDASMQPNEEALRVWYVLLAIDDLGVAIRRARLYDRSQRPADADGAPAQEQGDLPF